MPQLNHDIVLTNTLVKEIVFNFQHFFQDCDGIVLFCNRKSLHYSNSSDAVTARTAGTLQQQQIFLLLRTQVLLRLSLSIYYLRLSLSFFSLCVLSRAKT